MPTKSKDLVRALTSKGFVSDEGDHEFFFLRVRGETTPIRTKISHGLREIDDRTVGKIRRQMGALSVKEFDRFVECPMTEAEYVKLLYDEKVLGTEEDNRPVWERRQKRATGD